MIAQKSSKKAHVIMIVMLMIVTIIIAIGTINDHVTSAQEKVTAEGTRLNEILDIRVSSMSEEYNKDVEIDKIKKLYDFAGNNTC